MVVMKGEAITAGSKPIFSARMGRPEPTSLAQATVPTSVAHTTAAHPRRHRRLFSSQQSTSII